MGSKPEPPLLISDFWHCDIYGVRLALIIVRSSVVLILHFDPDGSEFESVHVLYPPAESCLSWLDDTFFSTERASP